MSETMKTFGGLDLRAFATKDGEPAVLVTMERFGTRDEEFYLKTQAHMSPEQARRFARAIIDAADFAEGKDGGK